jgi:hypothetical protein
LTVEEMTAIQARAEREGWSQHIMWLVIIDEMDADEVIGGARVSEGSRPLCGLPIDQ